MPGQWGNGGLELSPQGNPFIIYAKKFYYLLGEDETYSNGHDQTALWVELERRKSSTNGLPIRNSEDGKRASLAQLQSKYTVNASDLRASYLAKANTFDTATGTLTLDTFMGAFRAEKA